MIRQPTSNQVWNLVSRGQEPLSLPESEIPESISSKNLCINLPRGRDSKLIVVKIVDAREVFAYLGASENISHLDIVVANAGLSFAAPLRLSQATLLLLANTPARPYFVLLGSMQGSTGGYGQISTSSGRLRCKPGFLVRRLHSEHAGEEICIFAIDPWMKRFSPWKMRWIP
ncbi:hypothetical protein F4781DRAFT_436895 [Annulohypoxylon bovei var. microspora]|nr:hypothetical protein F4781DRAFT_436895 [Annulohypoxylon bovei var. microspora]